MLLKKGLLIVAIFSLIGLRIIGHGISSAFEDGFDGPDFDIEFAEDVFDEASFEEWAEEHMVNVTHQIGNEVVFSEAVSLNDSHDFGDDFANDFADIEDVSNINVDFGEDGFTFELTGTDENGDEVEISAEISEDASTINIVTEK